LRGHRYVVLRSLRDLRIEPPAGLAPSGFHRLPSGFAGQTGLRPFWTSFPEVMRPAAA